MTSRAFSDRSPSNVDSGDSRQRSTALTGASHAFSQASPVHPLSKAYIGTNGALAAATTTGMGMPRYGVHFAKGDTSNGKIKEILTNTPRRSDASEKFRKSREHSPSHIAALHATSKSTPASMQKSTNSERCSRQPTSLPDVMVNRISEPPIIFSSTNEAVGGATTSLVKFFNSKQNPKGNVPITHSVRYVTKPASAMASPVPIKPPIKPILSTINSAITFPVMAKLEEGFTASDQSESMGPGATAATVQSLARAQAVTIRRPSHSAHATLLPHIVPELPTRRGSGARSPLNELLGNGRNIYPIAVGSASLEFPQAGSAEPSTALQKFESNPSFLPSKLSSTPPTRPLLPGRSSRSFEMKVDSLANTIVAASLASSRATSPTRTPPPRPRRLKSHPLFRNHHDKGQSSRTPSPAKAMRQTMREPLLSDDGMAYKKKSLLTRKHPHRYHEGSAVTERERRRYDGVWAANKGLWMDADASESVLNLVVRDIWSRSRLPNDVLANIWDLVSIGGGDRLDRSEFIVGMWLIDQRLKGRKVPSMISERLWRSVRLLPGIKVSRYQ